MEKDQDENRKYQAPTEKSMLDVVFGKTLKDITKDLPEDDPIRVMATILLLMFLSISVLMSWGRGC